MQIRYINNNRLRAYDPRRRYVRIALIGGTSDVGWDFNSLAKNHEINKVSRNRRKLREVLRSQVHFGCTVNVLGQIMQKQLSAEKSL